MTTSVLPSVPTRESIAEAIRSTAAAAVSAEYDLHRLRLARTRLDSTILILNEVDLDDDLRAATDAMSAALDADLRTVTREALDARSAANTVASAARRIDKLTSGQVVLLSFAGRFEALNTFVGISGEGQDRRATFRSVDEDRLPVAWEAYRYNGGWAFGSSAERLSIVVA